MTRYSRPEEAPALPRPAKYVLVSREEIGERLRTLRVHRNLSQAKLGEILGTHQTNVSEMERGVRGITVQQLVRLSRALGVTPNEVLGMHGSEEGEAKLPARFVRRIQQLSLLPRSDQQALLKIMDKMIQASRPSTPAA